MGLGLDTTVLYHTYAPRSCVGIALGPFCGAGNVTSISKIQHCSMHIYDPFPLETCPMTSRQYTQSRRDVPGNPGPNFPPPPKHGRSGYKISSCKNPRLELHVHRNRGAGCPPKTRPRKKKKRRGTTNRIWSLSRATRPNLLFLLDVQLVVILLTHALVA